MSSALGDRALLAYTLLLLAAATVVQCLISLSSLAGNVTSLVGVLPWLGWVVLHSVVVRGGRSTGQFLLIAVGMTFGIEVLELKLTDPFHHTLHPQLLGVPLQVICAWIVVLYAGFAVTLVLVSPARTRLGALPFCIVAGLVTTALDLTADPVGVRLGSFMYHHGGAFLPEIDGANGTHGIPLTNYLRWMVTTTGTYSVYWLVAHGDQLETGRGQITALLFYVGLFVTAAIPAVRLGYPQLLLIGGLPVALVSLLVIHRFIADQRARELSLRRGKERARVTSLAERRLATHRR